MIPPPLSTLAAIRELVRDVLGSHVTVQVRAWHKRQENYVVASVKTRRPVNEPDRQAGGARRKAQPPLRRHGHHRSTVRSQTPVPTFDVVAVDVTRQKWPWDYLIVTQLPGQTWSQLYPQLDREARQTVSARSVGRRLNSTRCGSRLSGKSAPTEWCMNPTAAVPGPDGQGAATTDQSTLSRADARGARDTADLFDRVMTPDAVPRGPQLAQSRVRAARRTARVDRDSRFRKRVGRRSRIRPGPPRVVAALTGNRRSRWLCGSRHAWQTPTPPDGRCCSSCGVSNMPSTRRARPATKPSRIASARSLAFLPFHLRTEALLVRRVTWLDRSQRACRSAAGSRPDRT